MAKWVCLPLLTGLTAFASMNLGSSELGAASMVAGKERRRSGRRHRRMDFSIRRGSLPFLTPGHTKKSTGQASEVVASRVYRRGCTLRGGSPPISNMKIPGSFMCMCKGLTELCDCHASHRCRLSAVVARPLSNLPPTSLPV
jgi:hypothetical protein